MVLGIGLTQPAGNLVQGEPRPGRDYFHQRTVQQAMDRPLKDQERSREANSQQHYRSHQSYPAMQDQNQFADIHIGMTSERDSSSFSCARSGHIISLLAVWLPPTLLRKCKKGVKNG